MIRNKIIATIIIIVMILSLQLSVMASSVDDLYNKQDEIKNQITATEKEQENIKQEMTGILKQIQELTTQISEYEVEIAELTTEIETLDASIKTTTEELEKKQAELDKQRDTLQKRVVALYEAGETSFLDLLLTSSGIIDFISNYYLISEIVEYDTELANQIEKNVDEIDAQKVKLEKEQAEVKAAKENKEKTATALQNSKIVKDNYMQQLTEEEKALQQKIDDYEAQLSDLEYQIRVASSSNNGGSYGGGEMAWPTPGYSSITSPFGYRIHPVYGYNKFHSGVDIGAPYGAKIVAAASGTITLAQYNGGYGNCVMINHGGGISTLYAHGSSIKVKVGQYVQRGETVMIVGSTGVSTGAHLHFEVRVNGNYVNPLDYI